MNIVAIVQARMSSTRLPGKVMREICEKPMVWHVLNRVSRVKRIDKLILACSDKKSDDMLASFVARETKAEVFRGSETDVLGRYYLAAKKHNADVIIRVTADCPLISPEVINLVLDTFLQGKYDYVSNTQTRSFPHGLDVEIIPMSALTLAYKEADAVPDREHVMPFLWRQPKKFKLKNVSNAIDVSHLRWTVDTAKDLELIQIIYKELYRENPKFDWHDVCYVLHQHPEWSEINADIKQKQFGE